MTASHLSGDDFLSEAELRAMQITVDLVNVMCQEVISRGPQREGDVREFVSHVHVIQASILAQAASRAYPEMFRPLGGTLAAVRKSCCSCHPQHGFCSDVDGHDDDHSTVLGDTWPNVA